jgi:hypothetical protein
MHFPDASSNEAALKFRFKDKVFLGLAGNMQRCKACEQRCMNGSRPLVSPRCQRLLAAPLEAASCENKVQRWVVISEHGEVHLVEVKVHAQQHVQA